MADLTTEAKRAIVLAELRRQYQAAIESGDLTGAENLQRLITLGGGDVQTARPDLIIPQRSYTLFA
jgi:hypothetical protein